MPPLSLVVPARTRALNIAEREKIHAGIHAGWSILPISRVIGPAPSTVLLDLLDDIRRRYRPEPGAEWGYSPQLAQQRADANAARPKIARLAGNERLRVEVQTRLEDEHSPAQIAGRLRLDFADDPEMWVSHETIYQSIYVQGRGALRRELHKCLRTGRALRKPRRAGRRQQRDRIEGMINIAERPPDVEDRAVPGHWEGDLITGAKNQSAIGTLVERATGFTMLLHLPDAHGAAEVEAAMVEAMGRLPSMLRKTLTWDQGMEMANHAQIAEATDLTVYFCDPHSPWQRGTNENTNGLLRQYFPKGTDLSIYPADYLDYVAVKLNNRPRKRLDWKTPAEALDQLLSDPSNPPGVAMTG